jgi:hypothetical protein
MACDEVQGVDSVMSLKEEENVDVVVGGLCSAGLSMSFTSTAQSFEMLFYLHSLHSEWLLFEVLEHSLLPHLMF